MSDSLNVGTLRHFFKHFDTSSSRALHQTITHFHIKELESADYRSAYGQLSDWLYGWTVTDVTEMVDELLDHFKIKRPTREIDLRNDRERLEAERIMKIYETLFHITRRLLNKYYSDLDAEIPKIGKGVGTFKNGQEEENEFLDEDKDVEKVWALKSVEDLDNGEPLPDLNMLDSDQEEDQLTFQQKNSDVVVKRSSILHVVKETPKDKMHGSIIEEEDEDEGQEEGSEAELENDGFLPGAQDQESSRASSSQGHKIEKALSIEEGLPSNNAGFQFMKASSGEDMTKAPTLPTQLDEFENMQVMHFKVPSM